MKTQAETIIAELQSSLAACDHPDAARIFIKHSSEAAANSKSRRLHRDFDELSAFREVATSVSHHDRIDQMVDHPMANVRLIAMAAIRHHPIARRVKLLDKMTVDSDIAVHEAAVQLQQEIRSLRAAKLPHCDSLEQATVGMK